MGASGYKDHIVVCGWNTTARDLIAELRGDDYQQQGRRPRRPRQEPGRRRRLLRARRRRPTRTTSSGPGSRRPSAALVFPSDASDDADMRSILTIMAIEHVAPGVRTVAEVNNPQARAAFPARRRRRAAGHLEDRLAPAGPLRAVPGPDRDRHRHRVRRRGLRAVPDLAAATTYIGLSIDEVAARLRTEHRATLLSVNRGGHAFVNPAADFVPGGRRRRGRRRRVARAAGAARDRATSTIGAADRGGRADRPEPPASALARRPRAP